MKRNDGVVQAKRTYMKVAMGCLSDIKDSKTLCELFCLSFIIKMTYNDSILRNATTDRIKALLHCGTTKACNLLKAAKECKWLFDYDEANKTLFARNFNRKYIKTTRNRRNEEIYEIYRVKIEFKEYTLQSLLKEVKAILALNVVNAAYRRDEFNYGNKNRFCEPKKSVITGNRLMKATGIGNRTSMNRLMDRLEVEKKIKIDRTEVVYLRKDMTANEINELIDGRYYRIAKEDDNGYLCVCFKRYQMNDIKTVGRFQNTILNAYDRYTQFIKKRDLGKLDNHHCVVVSDGRVIDVELYFSRHD